MSDLAKFAESSARVYKGQVYTLLAEESRTRKDGQETVLLRWQSRCAECGVLFTFATPAKAETFAPNRRCQAHKRPGCRVGVHEPAPRHCQCHGRQSVR